MLFSYFCDVSGQKVNSDKTKLFCSNNVINELARQLSRDLGFGLTKDLVYYLRVLILHTHVAIAMYG